MLASRMILQSEALDLVSRYYLKKKEPRQGKNWKRLGSGISRTACLSASNIVYKIPTYHPCNSYYPPRGYDYEFVYSYNQNEVTNFTKFTHKRWIPEFELIKVPIPVDYQEQFGVDIPIIAMPFFVNEGLFNLSEAGHDLYVDLNRYFMDTHEENVYCVKGFPILIDAGEKPK